MTFETYLHLLVTRFFIPKMRTILYRLVLYSSVKSDHHRGPQRNNIILASCKIAFIEPHFGLMSVPQFEMLITPVPSGMDSFKIT